MEQNTAKEIKNGLLELFDRIDPIDDEDYLRKKTLFAVVDLLREIDTAMRTGRTLIDDKVESGLSEILIGLVVWAKSAHSEPSTNNKYAIRHPVKAIKTCLIRVAKNRNFRNKNNQTKDDYVRFIEKILSKVPKNMEHVSASLFFDALEHSLKELTKIIFSGKVEDIWFCFLKGFSCGKPNFLKVLRLALYKAKQA